MRGVLIAHVETLGARDGSGRGVNDHGRCEHTGKRVFLTEAEALAWLAEWSSCSRVLSTARAYRCHDHWHITSWRRAT